MAARKTGDSPLPETVAESVSEPAVEVTATVGRVARDETPAFPRVAAQFEMTSAEVNANMDKAMKTAEELVSFGQGNLEAMVKSSQIWAAGVQDLGKQFAASAQAQVDQTMATWKALATVKSFKEAMELQSTFARASMEKAVSETSKLTDASMKLAEQTFAPLTARMTMVADRFGRTV